MNNIKKSQREIIEMKIGKPIKMCKCDWQNGAIVQVKDCRYGSKCVKCGGYLDLCDWERVPWWRKLKLILFYEE